MATCNFEPFRRILKQKQRFCFVLSGKSDGDRTGIGRAEHLEKAHVVKKNNVFFTKFESDGERTGTDGERTGNGRGTDGERTGRN